MQRDRPLRGSVADCHLRAFLHVRYAPRLELVAKPWLRVAFTGCVEIRAKGANAIVAMRFDCNEIGDIMSEVAAYGTAVTIEPVNPEPTGIVRPPQVRAVPETLS